MKTRSSGSRTPALRRQSESETSDLGILDNDILSGRKNVKTMTAYEDLRRSDDTLKGIPADEKGLIKSTISGRVDKYVSRHYRRAKRYGKKTRQLRFALLAIQELYGLKIWKEWGTMSAYQRDSRLNKLKPTITYRHGVDLRLYSRRLAGHPTKDEVLREAIMMPWMNLTDLGTGSNLPVWARSRAFFEPYEFALLDYYRLKWAQQALINGPIKIDRQVVWLGENSKFKGYGEMFDPIDIEQADEWKSLGTGLDSEAGLLVLEAQKNTYEFLVKYCESFLTAEEILAYQKVEKKYSDLGQEPSGLEAIEVMPWKLPSQVRRETEEPYLGPLGNNLGFVRKFLKRVRTEKNKYWISLRQDPAYFAKVVRERHFGKISGSHQPNTTPIDAGAFRLAVKDIFRTDLRSWIMWAWLEGIAYRLLTEIESRKGVEKKAQEAWEAEAGNNQELLTTPRIITPAEVEANDRVHYRVLQLQVWLRKFSDMLTQNLLDSTYDVTYPVLEISGIQENVEKVSALDGTSFTWLRDLLSSSDPNHKIVPFTKIVGDLKWWVYHQDMRKCVSTRFANVLNDMSDVCHLIEALSTSTEWCACQDHDPTPFEQEYQTYSVELANLDTTIGMLEIGDIAQECLPLEEKLGVPTRATEFVEGQRSAQDLLSELMLLVVNVFDELAVPKNPDFNLGKQFQTLWESLSPESAAPQAQPTTDADTDGPDQGEPEAVDAAGEDLEGMGPAVGGDDSDDSDDSDDADDSDESNEDADVEESADLRIMGAKSNRRQGGMKSKNALRGKAREVQAKLPKKFKCDRKAYEVFQILFDRETAGRKSLKMEEFSYAMENIGFKTTKLAGSGFKYTYTSASGSTTFVEHGPHGSMGNTFPKNILRVLAARLKKLYGWSMETFKLEESKS